MTKIPFIGQDERATNLLEIIHSDVYSPLCVAVCGGFFYFTNDLSRHNCLYLLDEKESTKY